MPTNRREKSSEYNLYGDAIQKEVCELRKEIGRTCRDCEYEGNCTYVRYQLWKRDQKERTEAIKKGSARSE